MDWRFNTIWFDQIAESKLYQKSLKDDFDIDNNKFTKAEYAIIWHLKSKNVSFNDLNENDKLLYLELNCANIKNFIGLEKFKLLKRLELHYCSKLENDNGLSALSNSLEFLHINQSKKFEFSTELPQLKKLKVLCLNSCAPVENLEFLNDLPNLIDFRFVDTNILDGNLKPLLDHPTIRNANYINKKHYNFKYEKLNSELNQKSNSEYKIYVQNGSNLTYRYDYE